MFLLDSEEIAFPDPALYDFEGGLLAMGGDLSPERIWFAYQTGFFRGLILKMIFCGGVLILRFVLFPEDLKISKSMKKILREGKFTFTENKCFEEVMKNCQAAERKGQDGTWITDEMIKAYSTLHRFGKAKSIEVWENDELVGGLYGVDLGHVFCGESMFAKVSNASKAGFIYFVEKYKSQYELIDCQVYTEHLASLGAKEIPKREFLKILKQNFSDENVK